MVTHQLQVERRTGKVRRPETDVLPLCHATNCVNSRIQSFSIWFKFVVLTTVGFLGVDFVRLVLFSVAAFHAVTSLYLDICAYFVKLQNGSELDVDIEVFTPASVHAR